MHFQLGPILLLASMAAAAPQIGDQDQRDLTQENIAAPDMSRQPVLGQEFDATVAQTTPEHADEGKPRIFDDDDEPMVFVTDVDYRGYALEARERHLAEGGDPDLIVFESEMKDHVGPRQDGESCGDYAKRYSDTMNDMIQRGISILNDVTTQDQQADGFFVAGRFFLLTNSTKGEFREFNQWWSAVYDAEPGGKIDVPEKFLKFEQPWPEERRNFEQAEKSDL